MLIAFVVKKMSSIVFPKESKPPANCLNSQMLFLLADRKSIRLETSNNRFVRVRLFAVFNNSFPQLHGPSPFTGAPCQNEQLHDHLQKTCNRFSYHQVPTLKPHTLAFFHKKGHSCLYIHVLLSTAAIIRQDSVLTISIL